MSKPTDQQLPLRVVQITDCHLGKVAGSRLLNLDTDQSLAAVIELVRAQQPRIDVLLATGDLSDQGSTAAYRRFLSATRDLAEHTRWLPGNHDDPTVMRAALGADSRMQRNLVLGNWQIVMLDSSARGEVGGYLAAEELDALKLCLDAHPEHFVLICLHHQVEPVGCAWLDRQQVANSEQLWDVIKNYPQVRSVVSGHVHQRFDDLRHDVRVITSPSTCVQFAPNSDDFKVDNEMPGYRWFELHANGRICTGVERVSGFDYEIDLTATGY
ncbi:MAG: serine/threonine protein phosphatase [Verrucomicrobiaceae bacterium]|nr:serine/threonine protein phosphatase [Verrucomicrobiaceae bacterium]